MAHTDIPVQVVASHQVATAITLTDGDAVNYNSVDGTHAPKLVLIVRNVTNPFANVDFTVELAAGKSAYNIARSIDCTSDAEVAAILLDVPSDLLQDGGLIHIESTDVNFGDMKFIAYTWQDTPWPT